MPKLTIRDMRKDDIPAIWEIEQASFPAPWFRESFLMEIYNKEVISKAAVFEDRVIGYLCAEYRLYESFILKLAVHPDFRRQGVATILMREAMKELKEKGCVFMYLKVRKSNVSAREFYDLFGFQIETIRKKYYDNPDEDALLMMGRL
jgi:[ribosomal protein S18]-alanine N-acetyltransferase